MANLQSQIAQAKAAGYSDTEIAAHLASDPRLGAQIATARKAGYADGEIVSHLSGPPTTNYGHTGVQAAPTGVGDFLQRAGDQTRLNAHASLSDMRDASAQTNSAGFLPDMARLAGNAFNLAVSPVTGAVQAGAQMAGDALSGKNAFHDRDAEQPYLSKFGDAAATALSVPAGEGLARVIGGGIAAVRGARAATVLPRSVTSLSPVEQRAVGKFTARVKPDVNAMTGKASQYSAVGIKPTLVDTSGDGGQGLIRAVASKQTPGRQSVVDFANNRATNLPGNLANQAETARPAAPVTLPDIQGQVTSTGDAMGPRNGSQMVHTALNDARDAAQARVSSAYDAARSTDPSAAMIPADQKPIIASNLRDAVRDYDPRNIPQVSNELGTVDGLSTIQARDLFDLRSRLTQLRQSSDPVTAGAAGKAVRAVDGEIDRVQPMMTGDSSVVQSWRDAIASRRQFGQQFEGGDLIDTLTDRTNRGGANVNTVAPEDASAAIFGRSSMGFAGKPNLTRDLARVTDTLGADHPAVQGLQRETFERIVDASTRNGQLDAGALRDNLAKLGPMGDTLLPGWKRMSVGDLADSASRPDAVQIGSGVLTKTPSQMGQLVAPLNPAEQVNAQHGAVNALQLEAGKGIGRAPGLARDVAGADNVGANLTRVFGNEKAADLQNRFGLEGEALTNARNANPRGGPNTFLNLQDGASAAASNALDLGGAALRAKASGGTSLIPDGLKFYLKNRGFNDAESEALAKLSVDPSRLADVHQFIAAKAGSQTADGFLSIAGQATRSLPNAMTSPLASVPYAQGAASLANAFAPQYATQPTAQ